MPRTKPTGRPTTGSTKKPTKPSSTPASVVRPGTPASFSRRPGTRYFATWPTQKKAAARPSTVHAIASCRSSAQTAMAARTSTRPGSTGTTTPTRPTRIARPTSRSRSGPRSASVTQRSLARCGGLGPSSGAGSASADPGTHERRVPALCRDPPSSVRRRGRARSALLDRSGRGRLPKALGLVLDHRRRVGQCRRVLPPVVGAEQQLAPTGKDDAHVGLGPAAVAPVGRGEGAGGEGCGHDTFLLIVSGAPLGAPRV